MASEAALRNQQDLQTQYQTYKSTLTTLATRIGSLEQEIEEHNLVLSTLSQLPADRRCFRLVNGVLVERRVGAVRPLLEGNREGLGRVLEEAVAGFRRKEAEMERWRVENKVQVVRDL